MALREEEDAGGEPELRGHGRGEGERQQGVGQGEVLRARDPARWAVRVDRAVADGDDHVLDRPDRLEADLLGGARQVLQVVRVPEGPGVGIHESEFHASAIVENARRDKT